MSSLHTPPTVQTQHLRSSDGTITFDPLAVATVLPNPRAHASAVRLYTQQNRSLFRWPYLPMIGGTLPPLGALVAHLLSTSSSVHPALELAQQDVRKLEVTSNTVFRELPVDFSVGWVGYEIDFRPSERADNDFMVVSIDGLGRGETSSSGGAMSMWNLFFTLVGLSMGAIIAVELVVSVFLGDLWATALFFIYACHWAASTLVSITTMIVKRGPDAIREDETLSFAVHQRKGGKCMSLLKTSPPRFECPCRAFSSKGRKTFGPSTFSLTPTAGGTVIFKGRKDSLERWARQTWRFDQTTYKSALHWAWIVTGSIAAVGSTAAMVNMTAPLQLGFLGLLVLGSVLELVLTRISRHLELRPRRINGESFAIKDNKSRTQAIINAAIIPPASCRLNDLDWIKMGRLPDQAPFPQMQQMLRSLQQVIGEADNQKRFLRRRIIEDFVQAAWDDPNNPGKQKSFSKAVERENFGKLVSRIVKETKEAISVVSTTVSAQEDVAVSKEDSSVREVESKVA